MQRTTYCQNAMAAARFGAVDQALLADEANHAADADTADYASVAGTANNAIATNIRFTPEGGLAVKLTNNTGVNSVKGQIVKASGALGFATADANGLMPIGVVYDAGVANGAACWIVVAGIADVLIDAGGCVIGDWLGTGATAGSADGDNTVPAAAQHFQEIGHALETRVGAGLAKGIIHFN